MAAEMDLSVIIVNWKNGSSDGVGEGIESAIPE